MQQSIQKYQKQQKISHQGHYATNALKESSKINPANFETSAPNEIFSKTKRNERKLHNYKSQTYANLARKNKIGKNKQIDFTINSEEEDEEAGEEYVAKPKVNEKPPPGHYSWKRPKWFIDTDLESDHDPKQKQEREFWSKQNIFNVDANNKEEPVELRDEIGSSNFGDEAFDNNSDAHGDVFELEESERHLNEQSEINSEILSNSVFIKQERASLSSHRQSDIQHASLNQSQINQANKIIQEYEDHTDKIVILQSFIRKSMFKMKLNKSKKLLLAIYKGWLVRKLLRDNEIINRIMSIQDINAYIEELQYQEDGSMLDPAKKQRKMIITDFISTVNSLLNPSNNPNEQRNRGLSIYNWANKINQQEEEKPIIENEISFKMESRGSIRSDIPQTRQRNRYSVCIPASFRQLLTSGRRDSYNRRNSEVQDINLSGFQLAAIPATIKEEKIDEEHKKSKRSSSDSNLSKSNSKMNSDLIDIEDFKEDNMNIENEN